MPNVDLMADLARNESGNDPRPCRGCGAMWTPTSWNFYDLCDDCFVAFNQQKMEGRFASLGGVNVVYYEDAGEWAANMRFNMLCHGVVVVAAIEAAAAIVHTVVECHQPCGFIAHSQDTNNHGSASWAMFWHVLRARAAANVAEDFERAVMRGGKF